MSDDYDQNAIEFDPPAGYEPPEGIQVNQEYDALCSVLIRPDGTMCLKTLGGLPVSRSQAPERSVGEGMVETFKNNIPAPMTIPWDNINF